MVRVLVIDVIGDKGVYELKMRKDNIDDIHKALMCDTFDVAVRKITERKFDFYVDDIGLFADNPIPSVLDEKLSPMLVGNVLHGRINRRRNRSYQNTHLRRSECKHS